VLVYLKLKSPRAKDRVDLIELAKVGASAERCRAYLSHNAPHLVAKFEDCVAAAALEDQ
jgi:hypothetical protein